MIQWNTLPQRLSTPITIALLVGIGILVLPYMISAYYLRQGMSGLEAALSQQGLDSREWEEVVLTPLNLYFDDLGMKLGSSEEYLRQAIRWDPKNSQAYYALAEVYFIQRNLPASIEALSTLSQLRPRNPTVHLWLGDVYDAMGLAEEAVAEYERSQLELRGTSVGERAEVNYLKLADAYLKASDLNRALPVLQKILAIDPHNPYALYHFAKICETMGEGERLLAQGLYEQLHELQIPIWVDKRLYGYLPPLVPQLVDEGIWSRSKATQIVSSLISRSGLIAELVDDGTWDSDDILRLVPFATSRPTLAEAEWLLDYLRKRTSSTSDLHCLQGEIYRHQGQIEQALEAFQRAIDDNSFSGNGFGISSAYYRIGLIYQDRGEMKEALAAYQEALEADAFAGSWEKAAAHYEIGMVFLLTGRDLDDQIAQFKEALEFYPLHYWAHLRLGQAYYERYKDLQMAEEEIRVAMEIAPEGKWAYRLLGQMYQREGELDRAREMYERVLELDQNDDYAREALEALRVTADE